jgi:predicted alpha/beta superfamily hydrolase
MLANSNSKIMEHRIAGYNVSVYLPGDYANAQKYKVIYINDGQWLFGGEASLQLHLTLDSLIQKKAIEPVIIVGIHSTRKRAEDYVPYKIEGRPSFISEAKTYAHTVTEKIIPFIDALYNTIPNKNGRAIFGFSFGGLSATWLNIYYPSYFSFSAGFSPSFWVQNYQIIKEAKKVTHSTSFWFDIGTAEWNYYVPFIQNVVGKNRVYGKSVFYYEVPNGLHSIRDWKKRLSYPILIFAGKEKASIQSWNIEIEVIKSNSRPGVFYQRVNPIVTLSNGLKYSLADQANYNLQNKEDGQIMSDGRFKFTRQKDLKIIVSYQQLKKEIKIPYQKIQVLKKQ